MKIRTNLMENASRKPINFKGFTCFCTQTSVPFIISGQFSSKLRVSEGFYFLIKSAFILLAKLPSSSLFIVMLALPHLAGVSAHTHTHRCTLTRAHTPTQLPCRRWGGAAPWVFCSLIVLSVSLQLISSVCVSLSRDGAPSYLTPAHTVNPTIQLMYW